MHCTRYSPLGRVMRGLKVLVMNFLWSRCEAAHACCKTCSASARLNGQTCRPLPSNNGAKLIVYLWTDASMES